MNVLVTGGSGFIGAALVRNLLERGLKVVIGDSSPNKAVLAKLNGAEFEPMVVADAHSVEGVFVRHPDLNPLHAPGISHERGSQGRHGARGEG